MLNRENFYLSRQSFEIGDLLWGWKLESNAKFQQNISKIMPAMYKNRDMGCEYHCRLIRPKTKYFCKNQYCSFKYLYYY